MTKGLTIIDRDYARWVEALSTRYRQSQIKVAVKVNQEMLRFYWELGRDICTMKAESRWGSKFMANLSRDLKAMNPDARCFSPTNLLYMKNFYRLYSPCVETTPQGAEPIGSQIAQQPVEQLPEQKTTQQGVAKYALEGSNQPLGISEYELSKLYPEKVEGTIPTIEEIEARLGQVLQGAATQKGDPQ